MPSPINKCLAFALSISLPPSTPLTTLSYSIVFLIGSTFLNYPCNGLPIAYHSAPQLLLSHLISLLLNLSLAKCHKASFWAPYFLICTPSLSVLPLVSVLHHTTFMQMTNNSSSLSFHKTFPLLSPTWNLLYLSYLIGCHLTSPLILPKLNFFLIGLS